MNKVFVELKYVCLSVLLIVLCWASFADERQCSESRNLFLCANKRCIIYDFLCDETDDCGDRSDEVDCRLGMAQQPQQQIQTCSQFNFNGFLK